MGWYETRREEQRQAGLRQCARGKHIYPAKGEGIQTCTRCGKDVYRRISYRAGGYQDRPIH